MSKALQRLFGGTKDVDVAPTVLLGGVATLGRTLRLVVGGSIVVVLILAAIFADWIAPYDPAGQNILARLASPGTELDGVYYSLGADELGRDILSRIIHGARISLIVGLGAVAVQTVIGVVLGLVAGYYRRADAVIMRVADVAMAVPFFVLTLAIIAVLGPGIMNLIIVLGVAGWVTYARVVRSEVLTVARREYVDAARVLGVRDSLILARHVLPNVLSSVLVIVSLEIPHMIISEASLSFLGLGVQPPTASWGGMVASSRDYITIAWWGSTFPGLAILITVLGMNLLGDWVRDKFDPRSR